jgi:methylmalonyl-CoA/ethylmalonyl-CoA epimerase
LKGLNHVALVVPNLEQTALFYRDILHTKVSSPLPLPEHGVTTVFVELENTKIELLHPLGEKSTIAKFLEKNPDGGIHHICIEVDHLDNAVKSIMQQSIRTLYPKPQIGAHGKPVMFFHPKDCHGLLLELEQR